MASQFFATKSIADIHSEDSSGQQLRRVLTATHLTLLGIGGIIGTGIFVLTGTAAANQAGPALTLAFVLAGVGCALAGLCYAEFASMIPVSGSAYSYAYATLGEGIAWFIGWNLILEYLFAVATVSVGWSGYVVSFFRDPLGITIPAAFSNAPLDSVGETLQLVPTGAIINVPAMLIVAFLTYICYIGIKQSATFNSVIVAIKVTVVLLFIIFGLSFINTANWHPYIPPNTGHWGSFGLSGILAAAGIIFFAYIGFDAVSTAAQETKNPQRDMPIGMLASLVVCTVLYVIVKFGAIMGMTSVMLVMTLAQARIFLAMARDGLLPPVFGRVHPKFRTPTVGTLVTGITALIIGGLLPVNLLAKVVSIGTLSAFVTVCIGVLVLRRTRPDLPRPFRTPYPWVTCIAGAAVCGAMMAALGAPTWWRLLIWTIVGVLVYVVYGMRHSRVGAALGKAAPELDTGRTTS
jgi:APA family basic amino acid/polyamine antiporter